MYRGMQGVTLSHRYLIVFRTELRLSEFLYEAMVIFNTGNQVLVPCLSLITFALEYDKITDVDCNNGWVAFGA